MDFTDITEKKEFRLRPHHGMCLSFFEGKGYSSEFTAHMAKMKEILTEQNPMITLVRETDDICCACPHNKEGVCDAAQKVYDYDTGVLESCGLEENEKQPFLTFYRQVAEQILEQDLLQIGINSPFIQIYNDAEMHREEANRLRLRFFLYQKAVPGATAHQR